MKTKLTSLFLLVPAMLFCSGRLHAQAQVINPFAGNGFGASSAIGGYSGDGGKAYLAELNAVTGVTFDGAGNVYIADMGNNVIRKVDGSGYISTFAGKDSVGYSGDGGPAVNAQFNRPHGIATDVWGNVYVSDYNNNVIRMINTAGTISTFAGNGAAGSGGDGSAATSARLNGPEGIAFDNAGNLYIADANNNAIRVVYTDGTIGTVAGTGATGHTGDGGPAVYATFFHPTAVAVDLYGNLYIADYLNNAVRKVDTSGMISNFAGTGVAGYSGNGGAASAASLHYPAGVSIYGFGDVYIADQGNNVIRKVNTSGMISTYAGTSTNGYLGDGDLAVNAELSAPKGVSVDGFGRLYIADYNNNVVRIVTANTGVNPLGNNTGKLNVYPNPSSGLFTVVLPATSGDASLTVSNMLGQVVESRKIPSTLSREQHVDLTRFPAGNYVISVCSGADNYHEQVATW